MLGVHDDTLLDILRLIRTENVGPISFWKLIRKYGSAADALQALPGISGRHQRRMVPASMSRVQREIEEHQRRGLHLISYWDADFPPLLKTLPDCPPVLSVAGQRCALRQSYLGIVGGRNASLSGRWFAKNLARDLTQAGWGIASGLARGIDGSAHRGALEGAEITGEVAVTVAVLAGGVDHIYPPEHHDLYRQICARGAVISEMPLGLHPGATHFPRRNRIISGLSEGVVVIEAALRSGSLITAQAALDQGREVFAVPGSPLDARARGANYLIKNGAHVTEEAADILSVLQNPIRRSMQRAAIHTLPTTQAPDTDESLSLMSQATELGEELSNGFSVEGAADDLRTRIYQDLSHVPISIDRLMMQYTCSVPEIMSVLLELEISGLVIRQTDGQVVRRVV